MIRKPKIKIVDSFNSGVINNIYSFVPKDMFWNDGAYWLGLHAESWEQDEENYDNLIDGKMGGRGVITRPAPVGSKTIIRQYVTNLTVTTGIVDSEEPDKITNIVAGNHNILFNVSESEVALLGDFKYEVVDTLTGNKVFFGTITKTSDNTSAINSLPINFTNGSYIVRVKIHAEPEYKLPPSYKSNNAYLYEEEGKKYIYDPEYNIGRIPSDNNSPLLILRAEIIAQNKQKDKAVWAKYLIGPTPSDGEWSAIKLQVGNGAWEFNPAYLSSVGPVLKRIDENDAQDSIYYNFDPLARFISASQPIESNIKNSKGDIIIEAGSYLLAGNRSSANGPILALWVMRKSTDNGSLPVINLLGTHLNPSTGAGEATLLDHSATGIRVTTSGKIYILTKSSKHIFLPNVTKVSESIPIIPASTNGLPGGQALCLIGEDVYHFAENTGQLKSKGPSNNVVVQQIANSLTYGEGSVFHGPNCGESWLNKIWGIYQDKPFSDITAKQYLAYYDNGEWAKVKKDDGTFTIDSGIQFSANDFNWQRVIEVNNLLHIFGKRGQGIEEGAEVPLIDEEQDGIYGITDGKSFRVLDIGYRILKVVKTLSNDLDVEGDVMDKLLAIAYKVTTNKFGKSIVDTNVYYILDIDARGEQINFIFNPFDQCFVSNQLSEITKPKLRNTVCGPMDVALVIDDTGSMGGSLHSISLGLNDIVSEIEKVSSVNGVPDYRLALVTFKDDVTVRLNFAKNNKDAIKPLIDALSADGGGDGPEASDEAINTVFNMLPATGRDQNIDFIPQDLPGNSQTWRSNAVKIVVLVTDAPSGGFLSFKSANSDYAELSNDHLVSLVENLADLPNNDPRKDILLACVQVGSGYQGGPETLETAAEESGGAYLQISSDGSGAGEAIQAIVANCGGRSRPLDILPIDEFPKYFWWVDGHWEGNDTVPSDPTVCTLTRSVSRIRGENYGYISYCDQSRDRSVKNNVAFVWDSANKRYWIDLVELERNYFVTYEDLPQYLQYVASSDLGYQWFPRVDEPNYGGLEKSVSDGRVFYTFISPNSFTDSFNFKGLRFGGSGAWNPCDLPQPVLVFNPNNESFFIDLNILENRYNLTIDSLPPFLIADLIKGVWVAASVAPTTPVDSTEWSPYLTKLVFDTKVVYNLCQDCGVPYQAQNWYSRGLLKNGLEWNPVSLNPLTFSWSSADKKYKVKKSKIESEYGLSFTDLPKHLTKTDSGWEANLQAQADLINLELNQDTDTIFYNSEQPLTTVISWENRKIALGEDSYLISSGQKIIDPNSMDEVPIEYPFTITGDDAPLFIYDNLDNCLQFNKLKYKWKLEAEVTELPEWLVFSSEGWNKSVVKPTQQSYLERSVSENWIQFNYHGGQGSIATFPYAVSEWPNRGIMEIDATWKVISITPPKLRWNKNDGAFEASLDVLKDVYGLVHTSYLPTVLGLDLETECWTVAKSSELPNIEISISGGKLGYYVGGNLPIGYNLEDFPAITLKTNNYEPWCPATVDYPVFVWDKKFQSFVTDRVELKTLYGIVEPDVLPEKVIWNLDCWIPGNPSNSDIFLQRVIGGDYVSYELGEGLTMPYNPSGTYVGNALQLNNKDWLCPVSTCPPYSYEDCKVVKLFGVDVVRGNYINGEFVPCDCVNAWDCMEGFPDGTKWRAIPLLQQGLPINVIELVDINKDQRLLISDKTLPTSWYRKGGMPYTGTNEKAYLESFHNPIKLSVLEYLKKPAQTDIEIVTLYIPKLVKTRLPSVIRVI